MHYFDIISIVLGVGVVATPILILIASRRKR